MATTVVVKHEKQWEAVKYLDNAGIDYEIYPSSSGVVFTITEDDASTTESIVEEIERLNIG